ncbi:MAG: glycosyltransferase, partial [Bacteroidetes bacterium]|nr:glycosyltransferase [Bacteroidota bacterium]
FQPGKKGAIETGISIAKNELIITTDGDCLPEPNWLLTVAQFQIERKCSMVVGPVRLTGIGDFLDQFQIMEFAALQGITGATMDFKVPTMCNGANLAYLKSSFHAVGGFEGNKHMASGDDEFLLHKFWNHFDSRINFLKNPEAIVETMTTPTFIDWWRQRKRWASKWKSYKGVSSKLTAIAIFIFNLNIIFGALLLTFGFLNLEVFSGWLILKMIVDYLFIKNVNGFLSKKTNLLYFILMEMIYPFYTIIFGLAGLFGGYTWKGRKTK